MLKTTTILDLLKERLGSDYKTSLALGKRPSFVSGIRSRGAIMTDEIGLKAAELLDFPADALLLSLAAERATNTERAKLIRRLAEQHYPRDYPTETDASDPGAEPPQKAHKTAS